MPPQNLKPAEKQTPAGFTKQPPARFLSVQPASNRVPVPTCPARMGGKDNRVPTRTRGELARSCQLRANLPPPQTEPIRTLIHSHQRQTIRLLFTPHHAQLATQPQRACTQRVWVRLLRIGNGSITRIRGRVTPHPAIRHVIAAAATGERAMLSGTLSQPPVCSPPPPRPHAPPQRS